MDGIERCLTKHFVRVISNKMIANRIHVSAEGSEESSHGQLGIVSPWLSRLIMYGVEFWSEPKAPHVSSTKRNWFCFLFPNFPPWTPPKPLLILRRMPSTLRSASALPALWQCQRCDRTNDFTKNKRRCFSCRAWRDGVL